jgi:hypothetical protein
MDRDNIQPHDTPAQTNGNSQAVQEEARPIHNADNERTYRVIHIPRARKHQPQRWYQRGWLWLIVAVAAIIVLFLGLQAVAQGLNGVSGAIEEQTAVMEEQNGILDRIGLQLGQITAAISQGFQSLIAALKDIMVQVMNWG